MPTSGLMTLIPTFTPTTKGMAMAHMKNENRFPGGSRSYQIMKRFHMNLGKLLCQTRNPAEPLMSKPRLIAGAYRWLRSRIIRAFKAASSLHVPATTQSPTLRRSSIRIQDEAKAALRLILLRRLPRPTVRLTGYAFAALFFEGGEPTELRGAGYLRLGAQHQFFGSSIPLTCTANPSSRCQSAVNALP
jgi:hypothetical protein